MTLEPTIILPAEWAEQEFVQLTWPHAGTDWAYMLNEVNACFVKIALEIIKREKLLIVCSGMEAVKELLGDIDYSNITFAEISSNDSWARDHGGITVFENGKRVICDFTFNGWGMKFAANYDNLITRKLFNKGIFGQETLYRNCLDFILEGGSIESDGEGTLLVTSECLLSDNRNNMTKEEIEQKLIILFGLKRVLWLNHGALIGDDTDSHVDTLARLCSPDTIAYVQCEDPSDKQYLDLKLMEDDLKRFRTADGKPYNLIPLPMAPAIFVDGGCLPATYANFLIVNGAVLMPTYFSTKDELARQQLQKAFPDREIVGINCNALIKQHGSLHCVTMQYPKTI